MRKTDSRVLITGSYGQGNTGDEAILTAIVDQLRTRMPDVRLVVVAGDTDAIRRQFGVETVWWADWAAIAQTVQQSDMVIQGGGGIFFDYSGFHPSDLFANGEPDLAHYGGFSLLANLYRKPFMVYGAGVGPLNTDDGREMVKVAHLLADKITVRDAESKSLLEEIGIDSNRVKVTADPAFSLRPADKGRAREILIEHGIDCSRPVIAVTARPWDYAVAQPEWERSVAEAVSGFAQSRQAQILLIPFHKGYDDGPLLRIRERLANNKTFVLRDQCTPQEIAGVIGACDLLIGMRLHSILFAILTATPAIALAYDPKVRSLIRRIGHEEICVELNELSTLKDLIGGVWERRHELSGDFAEALTEMRRLSESNADIACELLSGGVGDSARSYEHSDMFADAFYGRLQAVRVRDRMIAKQDDARALKEIIGIMEEEGQPEPSRSFEMPDSKKAESLKEFLDRAVTESTEHLFLIYEEGYSRDRATAGFTKALADCGIPTIFVNGADQSAADATRINSGNSFHLPAAELAASWDDVLCASTPSSCRRVLLLRSADLNTFRLINHAHAMNWATVYYPGRSEEPAGSNLEAQTYVIKNAEHVVVGTESLKTEMQARGAQGVTLIPDNKSSKDRVAKILELVADTRSPVRVAIGGANCG